MIDKNDPGKGNRTFETRLEFIKEIFSHTFTKQEILASSVQFKLNKTYEQYIEDVNRSLAYLRNREAEKVIKKL